MESSITRWSSISANLLVRGQYVVRGLLASSFVKESLSSPKLVGFLGVLVLLASLIKQYFHPEISTENARRKATKLKAMIRDKNALYVLVASFISLTDFNYPLASVEGRFDPRPVAFKGCKERWRPAIAKLHPQKP